MVIKSSWYDDSHTIILHKISGTWTWNDLVASIHVSAEMMSTVTHKVCVMVDLSGTTSMPGMNMKSLQQIANAQTSNHPNMTVRYLIGLRPYLKTMLEIFGRIFPRAYQKYRVAKNIEDAIANMKVTNVLDAPRV